jgi:hypothetical protein
MSHRVDRNADKREPAPDDVVEQTAPTVFLDDSLKREQPGKSIMSGRFGRRPPLLIGIILYVMASIYCALAPDIEALTKARLLEALGGCAGSVVGQAVVRDRLDHCETARIFR